MLSADERTTRDTELREEWLALMDRVRRANTDLIQRAEAEGITFELDDRDTLKITIGELPAMSYTQRSGQVRMNLRSGTDEIVGFTISNITEYAAQHHKEAGGFDDLLPALRVRGTIQLPPGSRGAESMGRDLRELVPA
ncbi:MAG: hypothetical protein M3P30_10475 [Chloroflexota bacterium]|nr:hypothetical protein [Chloroflexota bacterium]